MRQNLAELEASVDSSDGKRIEERLGPAARRRGDERKLEDEKPEPMNGL